MLYMVEAHASMERGNEIDSKEGPGPVFQYIVERFKPQSLHGNPTRRQIFMFAGLSNLRSSAPSWRFRWLPQTPQAA